GEVVRQAGEGQVPGKRRDLVERMPDGLDQRIGRKGADQYHGGREQDEGLQVAASSRGGCERVPHMRSRLRHAAHLLGSLCCHVAQAFSRSTSAIALSASSLVVLPWNACWIVGFQVLSTSSATPGMPGQVWAVGMASTATLSSSLSVYSGLSSADCRMGSCPPGASDIFFI